MKYVAPLRYEVIFKKAFCQTDVFTAFVKDMAGVEMEIETVETEKRLDPPIGQVDSRFDLYAEDKKNRVVVDIQHVRFPDHYDRFLHYHCAAMLEQVATAKDYRPKLRVIPLVVLTSGDRHKADIATIDFDPKDRTGKSLNEIPHRVIYLCPPYADEHTPEPYREWLMAIDDSMDEEVDETAYQNDMIRKVLETIERDRLTPQERARMKDEYGYAEIGKDQFDKGLEKGIEKGIEKGREQEKIELARTMLGKGLDWDLIQEVTGLSPEVIAQLPQSEAE